MFLAVGYAPISSSATRPLRDAQVPISLIEVGQEQGTSGTGDREAIIVGAGLCGDIYPSRKCLVEKTQVKNVDKELGRNLWGIVFRST